MPPPCNFNSLLDLSLHATQPFTPAAPCLQLAYDKAVTDTACFVSGCRFEANAVFHAVVLAKGERVDWRKYEARRASETAKALQQGRHADAKAVDKVAMSTYSAMRCVWCHAPAVAGFVHAGGGAGWCGEGVT